MGGVPTAKVIKELQNLKKKVHKAFKIDTMLLFGSRAKGEEFLTSDVDVIVVSQDFAAIPFRQRPNKFLDAWKLPVDLEILYYSPAELKRKQREIGLVQEALKTAKVI